MDYESMKSKAYAPGHISTIFRTEVHEDLLRSGSRGAGIVIDEGVVTSVEVVSNRGVDVFFNGEKMKILPSIRMAEKISDVAFDGLVIRHESKLPIGSGFGVSGACALGVGLCLNKIFSLGLRIEDIGELAHVCEIECGTGLGDVGPILFGGIEVRKREGAYGYAEFVSVGGVRNIGSVLCFSFGGIDTKKVIKGARIDDVNSMSDEILVGLYEDLSLDNFMKYSIEFSKRAGFMSERLSEVIFLLNEIPGCRASQSMLGESGFVLIDDEFFDESYKRALNVLKGVPVVFLTKVGRRKPEVIR